MHARDFSVAAHGASRFQDDRVPIFVSFEA